MDRPAAANDNTPREQRTFIRKTPCPASRVEVSRPREVEPTERAAALFATVRRRLLNDLNGEPYPCFKAPTRR